MRKPDVYNRCKEAADRWLVIRNSPLPTQKTEAENLLRILYSSLNLQVPRFNWQPSPMAVLREADRVYSTENQLYNNPLEINFFHWVRQTAMARLITVYGEKEASFNRHELFRMHNVINYQIEQCLFKVLEQEHARYKGEMDEDVPDKFAYQPIVFAKDFKDATRYFWNKYRAKTALSVLEVIVDYLEIDIPPFHLLGKYCYGYLPLSGICIVCDNPVSVHTDPSHKRLHYDGGPAYAFSDGFAVHVLHGVVVPPYIAETPADKLSAEAIIKEENAEVRMAIVRKIGYERIFRDLNASVLDSGNGYELVLLDLKNGKKQPYLKMVNPSTGAVHVEGVHPDCATVEAALAWRNGMKEKPVIIT